MKIEHDCETDGRWIAEVPELPGVLVYGATEVEAYNKAVELSLRVIADRLEAGELVFSPLRMALCFERGAKHRTS